MNDSVFKIGNLVFCSPQVFANNVQMVKADPGLLPRELVYLTHGSMFEIDAMGECEKDALRKMLGRTADLANAFALLFYAEEAGRWIHSQFSHLESMVERLSELREKEKKV